MLGPSVLRRTASVMASDVAAQAEPGLQNASNASAGSPHSQRCESDKPCKDWQSEFLRSSWISRSSGNWYPFVFHETHGFSTDRQDGGIPDPSYSKQMVASQDLQFCANMPGAPGAPGAPGRARDWWPLELWQ